MCTSGDYTIPQHGTTSILHSRSLIPLGDEKVSEQYNHKSETGRVYGKKRFRKGDHRPNAQIRWLSKLNYIH